VTRRRAHSAVTLPAGHTLLSHSAATLPAGTASALQASKHPNTISRQALSAEEVLASGNVALVTTRLECARRADGAAALIVVSEHLVQHKGLEQGTGGLLVACVHMCCWWYHSTGSLAGV
jgi:hypothetical protein